MKLIKYRSTTRQRCLNFSDDVKLWRRCGLPSVEKRELNTLFQTKIFPEVSIVRNKGCPAIRYPWCFIAPYRQRGATHYFSGAFLPAQPLNDEPAVVLYTSMPMPNSGGEYANISLSFWLARALAGIADPMMTHRYKAILREACRPLAGNTRQPFYSWLCEPRCHADFEFDHEKGVDLMPWSDWPCCTENNDNIWLWRKTRHGKIIDSIKIPTTMNDEYSV